MTLEMQYIKTGGSLDIDLKLFLKQHQKGIYSTEYLCYQKEKVSNQHLISHSKEPRKIRAKEIQTKQTKNNNNKRAEIMKLKIVKQWRYKAKV